jgi:putative transposase
MALSESALFELLVVLTDRERGVDLVRELARFLAQELIEVQAAQVIGAAGYERTDDRVTERNGHRPRTGDDEGRRSRVADPEAAQGHLLPVDAGTAPAYRPSVVRGRDGGLRVRGVDPLG